MFLLIDFQKFGCNIRKRVAFYVFYKILYSGFTNIKVLSGLFFFWKIFWWYEIFIDSQKKRNKCNRGAQLNRKEAYLNYRFQFIDFVLHLSYLIQIKIKQIYFKPCFRTRKKERKKKRQMYLIQCLCWSFVH